MSEIVRPKRLQERVMVFSIYLSVIFLFIGATAGQYDSISTVKNKPTEINVIIFLVNSSSDNSNSDCGAGTDDDDENGTKFLNFSKATVILPCTPEKEAEISGNTNRILRYSQDTCDCKNLLKNSLKSLIGYARNAMGLTTAVSSIATNKMKTNAESVEVNNNVFQFEPNEQNEPIQSEVQEKFIPNKWPNTKSNTKRELLVPETVEVFNITSSGVKEKREENREIADIPLLKDRPETVWDMLGLMKTIRQSFFDNFFTAILDPEKTMVDEEDGLNVNLIGRVQEPSMFELVKRTLRQLEIHKTNNNGFLLTFFGGNICDIRNPRSDLMQSIKHVLENCDKENTLAVLTGSCPKDGRIGNDEIASMPLYVRGPRSEVLNRAKELYDVPKLVRVAMMEHHENKKRYNKVSSGENF